eukprot:scaffold172954_cov60-Attheya_sp.AAC.1
MARMAGVENNDREDPREMLTRWQLWVHPSSSSVQKRALVGFGFMVGCMVYGHVLLWGVWSTMMNPWYDNAYHRHAAWNVTELRKANVPIPFSLRQQQPIPIPNDMTLLLAANDEGNADPRALRQVGLAHWAVEQYREVYRHERNVRRAAFRKQRIETQQQEREQRDQQNKANRIINNSTDSSVTFIDTNGTTTTIMNPRTKQGTQESVLLHTLRGILMLMTPFVVFFAVRSACVIMMIRLLPRFPWLTRLYHTIRVSSLEAQSHAQAQRRNQRRRRYQEWVDRFNQERAQNGERPISAESLRLVLTNRDFSGNDYEGLLRFHDENGASAMALLSSSVGATEAEINRCPQRTIDQPTDDLLQQHHNAAKTCHICLEPYELHQSVRTIPCFHTFHCECIDPWLASKSVCPVCKHPAIA